MKKFHSNHDMKAHTVTGGGGIDIRADETGTRDGRPILFIHGFCGSRLIWHEQMLSDLADDFRLVAVDLRGHGGSEKPEDAYGDSELWAADIQAVIDELALDDAVLVASSIGSGWVTDYLAVQGEEAVAGVNMVGPRIALRDEDPTAVFGPGMLGLLQSGVFVSTDVDETIAGLEEFISLWTAEPVRPKEHVFLFGTVSMVPPYVRAEIAARDVTYDDVLSAIESPVLISHGEEDDIILPEVAETLVETLPNARTSFYPGAGHTPFLENPLRFNRELREFVAGL